MNVTPEASTIMNNLNAYIGKLKELKEYQKVLEIHSYDDYGSIGPYKFIPNPSLTISPYGDLRDENRTNVPYDGPMGFRHPLIIQNEFIPDDLKGANFLKKCIEYCEQQIQILHEKLKTNI